MLGAGVTSVLGFPYWLLAARSYPAAEVGVTAALLSTMFLVSAGTQLGLSGVLVRVVPVAGDEVRRVLVIAYAATALAATVVATAVVATVEFWSPKLSDTLHQPLWAAWFIAGTAFLNVFTIQDSVLAGLRRARWVPVENISYSVVKLALLALFASAGWSIGIFVSWVMPAGIAAVVVTAILFRNLRHGAAVKRDDALEVPALRRAVRLSLGNYIGYLALMGSTSLMPVMIVNELGAAAAAKFYAAWTIAAVLPLVASSFSTSLTVEGTRSGTPIRRLLRDAVIGSCSVLVPVVVVIVVAAPLLLRLFGKSYSEDASTVLRLLALAAIPNVVVGVSQGVARIQDRVAIIAAGQSVIAVVTIGVMAVLLRPVGIEAGGIAWLVGQLVGAAVLWCVVIRRAFGSDGRTGPQASMHGRAKAPLPVLGVSSDASPQREAALASPVSGALGLRRFTSTPEPMSLDVRRRPAPRLEPLRETSRAPGSPRVGSVRPFAGSDLYLRPADRDGLDAPAPGRPLGKRRRLGHQLKPNAPRLRWEPMSAVAITAALGTVLVAIAYEYGRENRSLDFGRGLLWLGLGCIYLPVFARMLSPAATRAERLLLVFMAGTLLYVVKVLHDPTSFGQADEYMHFANAENILHWGQLYTPDSLLPVSASYPGLPSLAAAVSTLTGLTLFVSSLIVVGVARVMLLIALFLVFERLANSARVAGVAALLYCAHPFYLMWSSQFAYESLSVPLMGAILVCLLAERRGDREPSAAWTGAALLLIAATAITHHVTSYVLAFVLWALVAITWRAHRPNRRYLAFAVAATACAAAWLLVHGHATAGYLDSNFSYADRSLVGVIDGQQAAHAPFGGSTSPTPPDEIILAVAGVLLVVAGVLRGGFLLLRAKGRRLAGWVVPDAAGSLTLVLAVGAIAWIGTYPLRAAPGAWLLGSRTSDFLFIGAALLMAWAATALADGRYRPGAWMTRTGEIELPILPGPHVTLRRAGVAVCACVAVLGGTVVGSDSYARLARPTQVNVADRVIRPQSDTVVAWAAENLPRTASIAADATSGRLLLERGFRRVIANSGSIGELLPTTLISGDAKRDLIAENAIDYVILDRRQSSTEPGLGLTFPRPDERDQLYPSRAIRDFEQMRGARRVFDGGDIVVFDVTNVRRPGEHVRRTFVAAAPAQRDEKRWLNFVMLGLALVPLALTLLVIVASRFHVGAPARQHGASRLDAPRTVAAEGADAQQRASRVLLTETVAVSCGLICLAISFVASGPLWLTATLGLGVAFVLPGHVVMSLLFGRFQPSTAERLIVAVALSIAVLILTVGALDAAGQRINRFALLSALVVLQLAALTTAVIRARAGRVALRSLYLGRPRVPVRISTAIVVGVLVGAVALALTIARRPAATKSIDGYSALSIERAGSRGVMVRLQSDELRPRTYALEARTGERVLAVRSVRLAPGRSMQLRLSFADQARPVVVQVQDRQRASDRDSDSGPPMWVTLERLSTGPAA